MSKLTYETYGDALIATFAGPLTNGEADRFQEELVDAMGTSRHAILDLSEVDDASGSGYRLMLRLYHLTSMRGGRMALVGLNGELQDTVDATGFGEFFLTCDDLDEALSKVRGDASRVVSVR